MCNGYNGSVLFFFTVSKRILKKITEDTEYPESLCGKELNETIHEEAAALPVQPSTIILPTAGVTGTKLDSL